MSSPSLPSSVQPLLWGQDGSRGVAEGERRNSPYLHGASVGSFEFLLLSASSAPQFCFRVGSGNKKRV